MMTTITAPIVDALVQVGFTSVETGGEAESLEGGVMVAYVVDLEGGMGDAVLLGQKFLEFAPAAVAVFVSADQDVGGES